MGKEYVPQTCNDLASSCRPQDFYFHIATVVVDNYKKMVSWWQRWCHKVCCHGPEGNSVLLRGSGGLGMLTIWQGWHVLQNVSASLSHPGHQTLVRSLRFIDTIPGWPLCARCRTWLRKLEGMMIHVPRSTNFPITESSFLMSTYRLVLSLCHISVCTHFLTFDSSLSASEACSISQVDSACGVEFSATNLTYSSAAELRSALALLLVRRERVSAMFSFPGMFDSKTIGLESQHPTIDPRTGLRLLQVDKLQGLWSVKSLKSVS